MSAAALAELGFAVFPCRPGDKRPAVPDWEGRACADPVRVARYWPSPAHNVGVACGPSRLVVVDLDVPKPGADKEIPEEFRLPGVHDGKDVFVLICEYAGMDFPRDTYIVQTPSGGWHLYFRAPEGSAIRNSAGVIAPMVDIRADGGYVVGAGSVTPAGTYEVLYDHPVQPLPNWIARLLAPEEKHPNQAPATVPSGPGRLQGLLRTVESAREGTRNTTLFWAACTLFEFSPADMDQLAAAAARNGLADREIARTIWSARLRVGA